MHRKLTLSMFLYIGQIIFKTKIIIWSSNVQNINQYVSENF